MFRRPRAPRLRTPASREQRGAAPAVRIASTIALRIFCRAHGPKNQTACVAQSRLGSRWRAASPAGSARGQRGPHRLVSPPKRRMPRRRQPLLLGKQRITVTFSDIRQEPRHARSVLVTSTGPLCNQTLAQDRDSHHRKRGWWALRVLSLADQIESVRARHDEIVAVRTVLKNTARTSLDRVEIVGFFRKQRWSGRIRRTNAPLPHGD